MEAREHEAKRQGKVTGSCIKTICDGTPLAKNKLMDVLNKPKPFRRAVTSRTPAPLAHGIKWEPWARSRFWDDHPGLDLAPDADFVDVDSPWWNPSVPIRADHRSLVGVSPDGLLLKGSRCHALLEVKCPYNRDSLYDSINGGWVKKWLHQMLWGAMLTGAPWAVLVIASPTEQETSVYKYREFWVSVEQSRTVPIMNAVAAYIDRWQLNVRYPDDLRFRRRIKALSGAKK